MVKIVPAIMEMKGAMITRRRQGNWAKVESGSRVQTMVEAGVVRKSKMMVIA